MRDKHEVHGYAAGTDLSKRKVRGLNLISGNRTSPFPLSSFSLPALELGLLI